MFGPVEIQGLSGLINMYIIKVCQLGQSQFYLVLYYCVVIYVCITVFTARVRAHVCVCVCVCVLGVEGLVSLGIILLPSLGLLLPIPADSKE